jgi:uncharacterized membrane protein YpjA
MNEIVSTIIFTFVLVGGVFSYAYYVTSTGKSEDENKNYIPDSWERGFKWFFTIKVITVFIAGVGLGLLLKTFI